MPYVVIIKKQQLEKRKSHEWLRVADTGNPKDGGAQYEYVPNIKEVQESIIVYEQTFDNLNISKLAQFLNSKERKSRPVGIKKE